MELRILRKEPRPNGTTVVTLDLDGVRRMQLVVKTEIADMLTEGDLQSIVNIQASLAKPPVGGEETGD